MIAKAVLGFLTERTGRSLDPGYDLLEAGLVSSLLALELVAFLERTFSVAIAGPDLDRQNFRSVDAMTGLVGRLLGGTGA